MSETTEDNATILDDVLELTLPQELQGIVKPPMLAAATVTQENKTMSTSTENVITAEQVKAVAHQTAKDLMAHQNAELAIANKIADATTEKHAAITERDKALAQNEKAQAELAKAQATITAGAQEAATLITAKKTAEDAAAKAAIELAKANADLAKAQAEMASYATDKSIAARKEKVEKTKLPKKAKDKMFEKAAKKKADSSLALTDAEFESELADTVDLFEGVTPMPGEGTKAKDESAVSRTEQQQAVANATPAIPEIPAHSGAVTQAIASIVSGQAKNTKDPLDIFAEMFPSATEKRPPNPTTTVKK